MPNSDSLLRLALDMRGPGGIAGFLQKLLTSAELAAEAARVLSGVRANWT